tara:strand:- start:49 stop:279 length:231 start_codon:yes stop_codon:yes gene_type:complete
MTHKKRQDENETQAENDPKVDDIYKYQKKYFKTDKGKLARKRARKNYDQKDPEKRRRQKREYMRRKRAEDPDIWRS